MSFVWLIAQLPRHDKSFLSIMRIKTGVTERPGLAVFQTLSSGSNPNQRINSKFGGERGIRTLGAPFETHTISNRAP